MSSGETMTASRLSQEPPRVLSLYLYLSELKKEKPEAIQSNLDLVDAFLDDLAALVSLLAPAQVRGSSGEDQ